MTDLEIQKYFEYGKIQEAEGKFRQAFFSYAQWLFGLRKEHKFGEKLEKAENFFRQFCTSHEESCIPIPMIILTYNALEYTKICLESIQKFCAPETFQLYVIDNCSTDGTREYLAQLNQTEVFKIKDQSSFHYVLNSENKGFAGGCNQGAHLAGKCLGKSSKNTAYFFLNNDTILMKDSFYNLAISLYEKEKTAAVGPMCNFDLSEESSHLEDYFAFAAGNNNLDGSRRQKVQKLVGYALMIKAAAYEEIGGFDEAFGIGNYEDDDLCIRLIQKGGELLFCKDSFLYHFGHKSFDVLEQRQSISLDKLLVENRQKFEKKWGFGTKDTNGVKEEFIQWLPEHASGRLLHYPCATGNTLLQISEKCPDLELCGIDTNESSVEIASKHFKAWRMFEEGDFSALENQQFDYILITKDFAHCTQPDFWKKIVEHLAKEGRLIFYFMNQNYVPFQMKSKDRSNGKLFFSLEEMEEILKNQGIVFTDAYGNEGKLDERCLAYIRQQGFSEDEIPVEFGISWYLGVGQKM